MKLPNGQNAIIDESKISNYLLNESHKVGWSKAKYLRKAGFNESNIDLLKNNLLHLACYGEIVEQKKSVHGEKFVVLGSFTSPIQKEVTLNTVWCIDKGKTNPRFITAYPN